AGRPPRRPPPCGRAAPLRTPRGSSRNRRRRRTSCRGRPSAPARGRRPRRGLDRKSTRLNSSHLVISYAVFCLKKKKKTINTQLYQIKNITIFVSPHAFLQPKYVPKGIKLL